MNAKKSLKKFFCTMWKTTRCFICGCALTTACRIGDAEDQLEDDSCRFEKHTLDSNQIIAGRYRVEDLIGRFPSSVSFSTQWQMPTDEYFIDSIEGVTSSVHVKITPVPGILVLHVGYSPEDGEAKPAPDDPKLFDASESCNTAIYVPVRVKIATEDGLLNEAFDTSLHITPFSGHFSHIIEGSKVKGAILHNTKERESVELDIAFGVSLENGWYSIGAARYEDDVVFFQDLAEGDDVSAKINPPNDVGGRPSY